MILPGPQEKQQAKDDLDIIRKYAAYRLEVTKIFSDTIRRRAVEAEADQQNVKLPKRIWSG